MRDLRPAVFLVFVLVAAPCAGQCADAPSEAAGPGLPEVRSLAPAATGTSLGAGGTMEARLEALERELAVQREELQRLRDESAMRELEALEAAGASESEERLSVYGFFDLTFGRFFLEGGSGLESFTDGYSSFWMSNVNLYFASRMTDDLRALVELRFTHLPSGATASYGVVADSPLGEIPLDGAHFVRTRSAVREPMTLETFDLGGVAIERVQLEYAPFHWLRITLGRYFTPFGIWNIDHGSPVVTTIRLPNFQLAGLVPRAQLGLALSGTVYLADALDFEYAVTVSNGRSPSAGMSDFDENKAVGARVRLAWQGREARVAAGGYVYYGTYRDQAETVFVRLDDTFEMAEEDVFRVEIDTTVAYRETIATADLVFEGWGVRAQAEYAWRRVVYSQPEPLSLAGAPMSGAGEALYVSSNFVSYAVYGLLSYELPLDRWLGPVRIAPYVMVEYNDGDERLEWLDATLFVVAGLNVKPSPYVTIKVEGSLLSSLDRTFDEDRIVFVGTQAAVSF